MPPHVHGRVLNARLWLQPDMVLIDGPHHRWTSGPMATP